MTVSVRVLGEELGIDRKAAERAMRRALDSGYLVNNEDRRGHPMRLSMGSRGLCDVNADEILPTLEEVSRLVSQ